MAIRVRRAGGLSLELAILSCRVLCDLHNRSWPLHLHAFAADRVVELQSFPLRSDEDFALLQVLALTCSRHLHLSTCNRWYSNKLRVPIAKLWFAAGCGQPLPNVRSANMLAQTLPFQLQFFSHARPPPDLYISLFYCPQFRAVLRFPH